MIKFSNVTKDYKSGHTALRDISFEVEPGEFVFIMGPSGSGKTTLLKLIIREIEPSQGQIVIAEQDLASLSRRKIPLLRRQIGSAFQDFKLIPDRSAFENVSLILEILGKTKNEIKSVAENLLSKVGLADKMFLYPSQLSGGEIQRVAIARAIASDPVLLFADEPTGNLDPDTSREIIKLLEEINSSGTTVMMATHDVSLAHEFPHRKITIKNGKLESDTKTTPKKKKDKTDKPDTK